MGTKAIFKIYNEGKFVIGSWVKYDGGVSDTSIFPYFIKNLNYDANKKSIYDTINQFVSDGKFNNLSSWNKNKPFYSQMEENGMTPVKVLFWEKSLSEKKLLENDVYGEYTYEIRFTKDKLKIKVIYGITEKTYVFNGFPNMDNIRIMIKELNDWVYDLDYGLNDCNCGEDNNEITE